MSRLPRLSGSDCVKALGKAGFYFKRQRGSHLIYGAMCLSLKSLFPNHRELAKGTLRSIIRQAGLEVEEFERLL